jgi:DNA helicase HerA-like ATPase
MSVWDSFEFHQLTRFPRVEREEREREPASRPLAAALTSAHASLLTAGGGAALFSAWVRAPQDRGLRFLLGGRPFFPIALGRIAADQDTDGAPEQAVLYPPGASGIQVSTMDVTELLGRFPCWVPCAGRPDALWAPSESGQEKPPVPRGSFDQHAAHLRMPFAWVVVAEPLAPPLVQPELNQLVNEILPLSRTEVGEAKRIELERKKTRHRDLSRAQVGGAWLIRILVGSTGERAAITAAATLCAASELDGLPYVLAPTGRVRSLAQAIAADSVSTVATPDTHGARMPVVASTELLVALARPPERELPGIRLIEPHTFDVSPESAPANGIRLGETLDEAGAAVDTLVLDHDQLNRHTFVCGATGGGKSHTVRHLLAEASRARLPWLVIEPAKAEYATMASRLAALGDDVVVIRPGDPTLPPAGFNPLRPERGFPLQTHVDLLGALFLASFEAHEPFPQVLVTALTRCYEELGWDLALGTHRRAWRTPRYPTLGDLQRVSAAVVADIGYGPEVAANIGGFVKVRMGSLRTGTTGRFFEGGHPLDFELLRGRNVVLEIQDVGDDTAKAFLMGAVLMRLTEHLRVRSRASPQKGLTHLTVIEEAHRLLRKPADGAGGAAAHAVEMFASLLAEVRAYGEGLVIAEQIPEKLIPDVIKNTAVKIVHRLPAKDDRESVGATMNLDAKQSRYVVALTRGKAAVFTDGMDRPLLVRVPPDETPDETPESAAEPAPVAGIIGRRSLTCGRDCVAEACTLEQLRKAQHGLTDWPWLTLWAELMVVAHLSGYPTPLIDDVQRTVIGTLSRRELDCALSQAVDDAVAVRVALLEPTVDPGELAVHCVTVLRENLAGVEPACDHSAFAFAAGHYKWRALLAELQRAPGNGPHPDTVQWQRRYARRIPGANRAEQVEAVAVWYEAALADQPGLDAVTFGTSRPSALEQVIGGTPADVGGWDSRVAEAVTPFGFNWPSWVLIPLARHQDT